MSLCAERRARVTGQLVPSEVDALLVSDLVNLRYLTGVNASNGALVVTATESVLVTDSRYEEAAAKQCPDVRIVLERDALAGALATAAAVSARVIGFEAAAVSIAQERRLSAVADELGVRLVPVESLVEEMRLRKDDEEISLLKQACDLTESALARLLPEIRVGVTERWIAARLEFLMRDEGAEAAAFPSIVATGPNSAEPHHEPTGRAVGRGDLLKIDCGARHHGYHADMTRTFVVGTAPTDWQADIHRIVARAAAAGRDAVCEGVRLPDLDAAARGVITDAGWGEYFGHGLGHGVGLQIHEAPMVGPRAVGTLAAKMTVTIEPGVYQPGQGGVRIEDSLVVTPNGSVSLTSMTRELLVLG